jgi:hypothetical protein
MTEIHYAANLNTPASIEYQPRAHTHEGRILQIAARSMNVNVGEEEVRFWQVASKTAAALDTLVDEQGWRDVSPIFETVISDNPQGIEGVITVQEAQELADFYGRLSPERQDAWYAAATSLPLYADYKAEAPSIEELIRVTLGEADDVFSQAFQLDTSGKVDEIPREKFNRWLTHFARTGYAIDAAFDMPRDFKTGVIRVKPTILNRTEMLFAAREDMPKCFMIGRRAVLEFARTGWATFRERSR